MTRSLSVLVVLLFAPVVCFLVTLSTLSSLHGTCAPSWSAYIAFGLLVITATLSSCTFCFVSGQIIDYARVRYQYRHHFPALHHADVAALVDLP